MDIEEIFEPYKGTKVTPEMIQRARNEITGVIPDFVTDSMEIPQPIVLQLMIACWVRGYSARVEDQRNMVN